MNADTAKLIERLIARLETLEGAVRGLEGRLNQYGTPYPQPWPQPNYTGPYPTVQPGWPPQPYCTYSKDIAPIAINSDTRPIGSPGDKGEGGVAGHGLYPGTVYKGGHNDAPTSGPTTRPSHLKRPKPHLGEIT